MSIAASRYQRTLWLLCPLVFASFLFAGCQEDSRASRTSSERAAEIANARLDNATGGLLATLGQSRDPEPAASSPRELSWTAPLTREDGSALAPGQIAGFRIYYRLRHQENYEVIRIESPSTTRLSLAEMAPGAYEFAITTVDTEGLESRRSTPVTVDLI